MNLCDSCLYSCQNILKAEVCDRYTASKDFANTIFVKDREEIKKLNETRE